MRGVSLTRWAVRHRGGHRGGGRCFKMQKSRPFRGFPLPVFLYVKPKYPGAILRRNRRLSRSSRGLSRVFLPNLPRSSGPLKELWPRPGRLNDPERESWTAKRYPLPVIYHPARNLTSTSRGVFPKRSKPEKYGRKDSYSARMRNTRFLPARSIRAPSASSQSVSTRVFSSSILRSLMTAPPCCTSRRASLLEGTRPA